MLGGRFPGGEGKLQPPPVLFVVGEEGLELESF